MRYHTKIICAIIFIMISFILGKVAVTRAALIASFKDSPSRVKAGTSADHTIQFKTPTGVDEPSDTIVISFPAGFSVPANLDFTDIDLAIASTETGAQTDKVLGAGAGIGIWGVEISPSARKITFIAPSNASGGEIPGGNFIFIEIGANATSGVSGDQQITNPATAGSYNITISGAFGDRGTIAIGILGEDQLTISASVEPFITFSVTGATINFGTLSRDRVNIASEMTALNASTNAPGGFVATVKNTGGLSSASHAISSSFQTLGLAQGIEGYGIQCNNATGNLVSAQIDGRYNQGGDMVGGMTSMPRTIVFSAAPIIGGGCTVTYKAAINNATPGGAYADTITYATTGTF